MYNKTQSVDYKHVDKTVVIDRISSKGCFFILFYSNQSDQIFLKFSDLGI